MKRGTSLAVAVLSLLGTVSATSASAPRGFAVDRFEPSERGSWFFIGDSLDFRRRYALGVVGAHSYRSLVGYTGSDGTDRVDLVRHQLVIHAGGSIVLAERLRLALDAPLVAYQDGEAAVFADGQRLPAPTKSSAAGDVRLASDCRLIGAFGDAFVLAAGLRAWIPSGVSAQYAGDGAARLGPQVMASGTSLEPAHRWIWAARMAFVHRWRDDRFAGNDLGAEVTGALALGARLFESKRLIVGPEIFASTGISTSNAFFGKATTPVEALLGAHYEVAELHIGALAGAGLTAGMGAPMFRAGLSIAWVSAPPIVRSATREEPGSEAPVIEDSDGDGVLDTDDACPSIAGIRTSDHTTNGCPQQPEQPLAKITATEIKIDQSVRFETDSATLLPSSDAVLDEVKRVLEEHPEIRRLRVEGHTDNVGDDAYNVDLSTRRAASVVTWLTRHGISPDRLSSEGFGSRNPIDTNETEAGRSNNRRVVFRIIDRRLTKPTREREP